MSARHLRDEVLVADNPVLGRRLACLVPVIPDGAPYAVREGMARRRIAATTGTCTCGAVVDYGQADAGEVGVGEVDHERRCPASTTKLVKAVRWWRR